MLREYQSNFIALACRSKILTAGLSKKIEMHQELIDFLLNQLDSSSSIPTDDAINTEANLSSEVLQEIMRTVGVPFDEYWQKKGPIIDHQLLKTRNEIAHGQLLPIDQSLFEQLHDLVIECLDRYKTLLENAAVLENYKKSNI